MARLHTILLGSLLAVGSFSAAQAAGQVKIATDATFPPFESVDSSGKLVGYDVELMNAVCKAAELNCNVIAAAWEGMIPGLTSGKYDALISQLTVTPARRKVMAFSDIYETPVFRFVAKKDAKLDISPDGLAGKVIAVQTGTPMDAYVTKTYPKATIKRYDGGSAPYLELSAGRADLHMSYEAQITHSFLNKEDGKDFELVGPRLTGKDAPEFGEGVAIAVNKRSTDLLAKINAGLAKIKADGQLDALNAKYLGEQ
ncbi:amino acid ABC transporter substrate-binding protein, PAAT family [Faunimonas pinastri]|uniref:Amino acid ABC transporter substrate-binding protein, PAAT family n=1 Tax=Faunimonas pinastri TaxID=1855383 RepID=A0A1H9B0Z5_9HYPH|nr:transporter substrate-binding domain-containing protein [Faunimonas pinastri]SEP82381.1 amino acid ABC transporter substrate-binding protein, PAAT family [Faunimonas pinastri]